MFDPKAHLIQLPRRVKDPTTGHFTTRYDEYLEVKWRLVWFREKYPHGHIGTEFLRLDWEQGIAICKGIVNDGEGGYAHGTGTETRKGFEDFVEKAETRSIGRALAALGIGTQFVGEELSEGEHIVDAPVTTTPRGNIMTDDVVPLSGEGGTSSQTSAAAENIRPSVPVSTNGHTPPPAPTETIEYPTEGHMAALRNLAITECGEDVQVYEDRIRRTLGLKPNASVSPRLMTRVLTMAQYMDIFAYYRRLEAQLAKGKETPGGTTPQESVAPQPAAAPTGEGLPPDPSAGALSSAPEPSPNDAAERDRQRLRAEVAQWDLRVPPEEVEYIILRNPYSKARQLLWKCRRQDTAAD